MAHISGIPRIEPVLILDSRWLAVIASLVVLVCSTFMGALLGERYEDDMHRGVRRQLISLSRDASQFVDGDAHRALRQSGDMESAAYKSGNEKLRLVLNANENLRYIYTCYLEGGQVKFGFDPTEPGDHDGDGRDDHSKLGEIYADPPSALVRTFHTKKSEADDKPYVDEWGTFISAYSPVFAKDGSVEAVVGVDLTAELYAVEMESVSFFRSFWLVGSIIFSGLCGLVTLYVLNRVHKRFLQVLEAKREVEATNAELEKLNRKLDWQARTDILTGLLNRSGVMSVVDRSLAEFDSGEVESCAVALMDLDDFKVANDHYGHAYGDQYLVAFAESLVLSVDNAVVGRLGGDEFIVVMTGTGCCERLEAALREFQAKNKNEVLFVGLTSQPVSVSIGVVEAEAGDSSSDLIRRADIAMYEAKRLGAGNLKVYEDWMGSALDKRVDLEKQMRLGWEQGEFWMAVQPIVDLQNGDTVAGEMLMRWTKSDGTFVSPVDFIPIAEDTGLIMEMGLWAIEEACRNVERLEREFKGKKIHLSVNVSPRQLNQPNFVDKVEEIFGRYTFHRGGLWFELTESSLIHEGGEVLERLKRIREMGIMVALDDFGTGYSSLSMLLHIPLDCLKIDRSFIQNLPEAKNSVELVHTILRLSEMLKLHVVCEGIETKEQGELLHRMGCDWGQGFHYSKPVPMSEFVDRCCGERKVA